MCECLWENVVYFCICMEVVGFIMGGVDYVIIFIMLGDVKVVVEFVECVLVKGIYVIGFLFLVVLKG